MKQRLYIVLIACLTGLPNLCAQSAKQPTMTAEREQQFTYYFYDAQRQLRDRKYDRAMMELLFAEHINPYDGQTKDMLGMLYHALNQHETAKRYFANAYRLSPKELWQHYAKTLFESEDMRNKYQAVVILEQAGKDHPKDEEPWDQLIEAYLQTEQYRKALQAQDHLDGIKGYDAYSAITRYRTYALWGKNSKALKEIDRYLELEPRDVRFLRLRLESYERLRVKWSKLEKAYQEYLKIDPYHATTLNNYAYGLAIHKGDLKKAEQMSLQTVREQPDNPVFLDTYAWILHLKGEDNLALFYIKKALENSSADMDKKEMLEHMEKIQKGR